MSTSPYSMQSSTAGDAQLPNSPPIEEAPPAPDPTPDPAPEPSEDPTGDPAPDADPPEFTPNFKVKVMDQEHEVDEFLRGAVTTPEHEKRIRELYEKAHGLDVVKPRYQELREKYKGANEENQKFHDTVQRLQGAYQRGDMDAFFQELNVPQEKILQWVVERAQYNQMPPEQRQVLDARRTAEQRVSELERENQRIQHDSEQVQVKAKEMALNTTLLRPDVVEFAKKFDTAIGKPGAFRNEVITRGELAWQQRKVDISPDQAVEEVKNLFSKVMQGNTAPTAPTPGAPGGKEPPIIPNVSGRAASPTKPKVRSLDDLKALAEKAAQAQGSTM